MKGGPWDLEVLKKVHRLTLDIYDLADRFPTHERFRMVHQLCRAAVSIGCNIAEGDGRFATREQIHFLMVARGSLYECQFLLRIARDRTYCTVEEHGGLDRQCAEIGRMINGLARAKRSFLGPET